MIRNQFFYPDPLCQEPGLDPDQLKSNQILSPEHKSLVGGCGEQPQGWGMRRAAPRAEQRANGRKPFTTLNLIF